MTCGRCGSSDPCTPTVYVVDDDKAMRHSLAFLLKSMGHPVECFPSAEAFLLAPVREGPGCLVLDIRMPGMSGLDLQSALDRLGSTLGIVFISGHGDIPMVVRAMRQGAVDFLEKPFNDQRLLDLVTEALRRGAAACGTARVNRRLAERFDRLTLREREVMALVIQGRANKMIAHELGISMKTVEVHRARVMEKMAADSVADLTRMQMTLQGKP